MSEPQASFASRPGLRVAQGSWRSQPRNLGSPSFWLLFLGEARKSTPATKAEPQAHSVSHTHQHSTKAGQPPPRAAIRWRNKRANGRQTFPESAGQSSQSPYRTRLPTQFMQLPLQRKINRHPQRPRIPLEQRRIPRQLRPETLGPLRQPGFRRPHRLVINDPATTINDKNPVNNMVDRSRLAGAAPGLSLIHISEPTRPY